MFFVVMFYINQNHGIPETSKESILVHGNPPAEWLCALVSLSEGILDVSVADTIVLCREFKS